MGELSQTTERTARIVHQLLALGRIDPENRGDMDFALCDLVTVAEDVGSAYADHALSTGVDLELVAPVRPAPALVVHDLVVEALANLVDNALRYTPPAGRIVVEVRARPLALQLSDSGPGTPDD